VLKKLKILFVDIIRISKLSNVQNKKLRILLSIILSQITVAFDLLIIVVFSRILGQEITSDNIIITFILENLYILPLIILARFAAIYIEKTNIQLLVLQIMENLKEYILKEVYKKGNFSVADASFYSTTLSEHISTFYGNLAQVITNLIQLLVYSVFLIYLDLRILSFFILGGVLLIFPTRYFLMLGRKYMHDSYIVAQDIMRNLQKVIDNIFLIKILKTSEVEFRQYKKNLEGFTKAQFNNVKFGIINSLVPNFTALFILSLLVGFFELAKTITIEFLGVTLRLVQTLGNVNLSLNQVVNTQVHIEKFNDLEREIPTIRDYYSVDENLENFAVRLNNISFKYFNSKDEIFTNLNLNIRRNKHTIITGPNGSGKSTLLGLIAGIYYPDEGLVSVSSNKLGYVGVNPLIIETSLRENLTYGNSRKISDKEILDSIEEFNLFAEDKPVNLDVVVSNRTLSSGQMQKISFIRSMLSDANILLLDESTSNLDVKTKQFIFQILKNKEITIINSTHNQEDFTYDDHLKIDITEKNREILVIKN
jgi:ABC-type bacteriocin/lantibiotic exporter with double-glycine peptidase domain